MPMLPRVRLFRPGSAKGCTGMLGRQLFVVDPHLRPRPGQRVSVEYLGEEIPGQITSVSGPNLEIHYQSRLPLEHVRPNVHLRVVARTGDGVSEFVITGLRARDELLGGQIVGHPVPIERRAEPRVGVRVEAILDWLDPESGEILVHHGQTENISLSGALLRFPPPIRPRPEQDLVALLGLRLPGSADLLRVAVRVLQAWEDGARVHVTDASPPSLERLQAFVASRLTTGEAGS